ncbi:MAG: ornithine cyclodeaminase family protein [Acidimicrobiaceae bacterium]|nr:ornithine cyclodeaminase family protein [Acidimicrobiaceae bacterium]MYE75208.1 ornithine cyclodeaminase family protein [Acidimicrobiaceae bacterium]MYJ42360.1 ornithine cyclodeaminase family protein [Acidimicrobiaceae bacterium]
MSAVPHLTEEQVAELCDLETVTDWLERAWRDLGAGEAATTLRVRAAAPGLMGSAMAASWPRHQVVGGKLYLTHPGGFAFLVGLFSPAAGLVATFDGLGLTAIRTAAASALAVRHLAPPDATTAAVFGTGNQSRLHMQALAQELPLRDLRVWGRDPGKAEEVAAWGRDRGIPARAVADPDGAVSGARVVATVTSSYTPVFDVGLGPHRERQTRATVTSSYTPVFDGSLLDPAALVCAVGSTKADRQEVDSTTVQRTGFVVSDSAEGARTEAGDLIHAAAEGVFDWDSLADLADVIAGTVTPPQPGSGIVLFESQGVALQDVVIATLAYQRSL